MPSENDRQPIVRPGRDDTSAREGPFGDEASARAGLFGRKLRAYLSRLLGDRGERAAARYLRRKGLRVLARGHRTRCGEIDLIARDGDFLVFVEVKSRRRGTPAEAVTAEKQRRITLAALGFLRRHGMLEQRCRFDIVAIVWPDDRSAPQIDHIPNAFEAVGRWQMFR